LLIGIDEEFPPAHSIARLLEIALDAGIEIPKEIMEAVQLTDYAVKTRYPGEIEPVTKKEYEKDLSNARARKSTSYC